MDSLETARRFYLTYPPHEISTARPLTIDLRDLAQRAGRATIFEARLDELRKRHPRRRGYLDEVKRRLADSTGPGCR